MNRYKLNKGDFMRFQIRFGILLLLIGLLSLAIASGYDKRFAELKDEAVKLTELDPFHRAELIQTYLNYTNARNEGFNGLLGVLREERGAQKLNFDDRINVIKRKVEERENDMVKLSPAVLKLYQSFKVDEFKYLDLMQKSSIATRHDTILEFNKNLNDWTYILGVKWNAQMENDDRTYDQAELATSKEIKKLVEDIIVGMAFDKKNIAEKVEGVLDKAGGVANFIPVLGQVVSIALDLSERAAGLLKQKKKNLIELVDRYKSLVNSEANGMAILFSDVRKDTKDFIEKNGFDQAKREYSLASDDLKQLSSEGTPGQRDDGKEFADEALKAISPHLSTMESSFNRFIKDNQGKFFGPVSPDISEALVETKVWERERDGIRGLDLEGKLRQFREDENRFFEIKMSKITDEQRKQVEEALTKNLQVLNDEVKITEQELKNDLWVVVFDRKALEDKIKNGS
jgi:hypothetical protein